MLQREGDGSVPTAVGNSLNLWGKPQGLGREIQTGIHVTHPLQDVLKKYMCLCLYTIHVSVSVPVSVCMRQTDIMYLAITLIRCLTRS